MAEIKQLEALARGVVGTHNEIANNCTQLGFSVLRMRKTHSEVLVKGLDNNYEAVADIFGDRDGRLITRRASKELRKITSGKTRHFTRWSSFWEDLELMGLVSIKRPIDRESGLTYECGQWEITTTEEGHAILAQLEESRRVRSLRD